MFNSINIWWTQQETFWSLNGLLLTVVVNATSAKIKDTELNSAMNIDTDHIQCHVQAKQKIIRLYI